MRDSLEKQAGREIVENAFTNAIPAALHRDRLSGHDGRFRCPREEIGIQMRADHVAVGIPSGKIVVNAGWMWKGVVAHVVPRRIKKVQSARCCILSVPRLKQRDRILRLDMAY